MSKSADKSGLQKGHVVAGDLARERKGRGPALSFSDDRPRAVTQRTLQEMADVSPRAGQLAHLGRMADTHLVGDPRTFQFERSKNPNRSDDDVYKTDSELEAPDLTEHHIVPHELLVKTQKKLATPTDAMEEQLPKWDDVTVRQMTNLKSGWKIAWIAAYNTANADALIGLDSPAKDWLEKLKGFLAKADDEDTRREGARLGTEPKSFRSEDEDDDDNEPDENWTGAFFEWMPGNVVLGPTARKHDQKDGMALDKELLHLFDRLGQGAHKAASLALDTVCRKIVTGPKKVPVEVVAEFDKAVRAVSAFAYTPYKGLEAHWVDAGGDKLEVQDYGGN